MTSLIFAALVILSSASAAAATGFGFNLFTAPLLSLIYPPKTVVVVTLILGAVTGGALMARLEIRKATDWVLVTRLFLSSLAGMPAGVAALLLSQPRTLRLAIAALTALFALSMLAGFRPRVGIGTRQTIIAGALSGFFSTSTSLNGPPVAFLLITQNMSKDRFRANVITFVFLATLASLVLLGVSRNISLPDLRLTLFFLPFALLGLGAGLLAAERLSQMSFDRVVLAFLAIVGFVGILRAFV